MISPIKLKPGPKSPVYAVQSNPRGEAARPAGGSAGGAGIPGPGPYLISAARPGGARGAGAALCPTTWSCCCCPGRHPCAFGRSTAPAGSVRWQQGHKVTWRWQPVPPCCSCHPPGPPELGWQQPLALLAPRCRPENFSPRLFAARRCFASTGVGADPFPPQSKEL